MSTAATIQPVRTAPDASPDQPERNTSVITVRIPASLHGQIKQAARENGISINQFCVGRIVDFLDQQAKDRADAADHRVAAMRTTPEPAAAN